MKVFLSILSISMLSTMWLGPGIAGGAQLLSDDELDEVTAAGSTNFELQFFDPTQMVVGLPPTTNPIQPPTALDSAFESVSAAAASAEAARAVSGNAGLAAASTAVSAAAVALETASIHSGLESLNAGRAALTAAGAMLNSVPMEQHTPAINEAVQKVNQAAASLNQAALNAKAIELNSAVKAVEAAKIAINALPEIGGKSDHSHAIDTAVNSIQFAKGAIEAAAQAQAASGGSSQTVLLDNGNSLNPILRINFSSGRTVGSADIIPILTRGGPGQPGLDLDGATIAGPNGLMPFTVIAETLMLNINMCVHCIADKIIQNNNGFIVPIYAR